MSAKDTGVLQEYQYPRSLVVVNVVAFLFTAIIQFLVMIKIDPYFYTYYSNDEIFHSFLSGSNSTNHGEMLVLLGFRIMQYLVIFLLMIHLSAAIISYAHSKLKSFDRGKQLIVDEGSSSELNLRNLLIYRKNGIPSHQLIILSYLLGYFIGSLFSISVNSVGIYSTFLEILIMPVLSFIIITIITLLIYRLRDNLSLTRLRGLNKSVINFSLILALFVSGAIDIELFVLLGLILVYSAYVLSIMKLRKPVKVYIEDELAARRFIEKELPNLDEPGFSKYTIISLGIAMIYQILGFAILYFEVMEHRNLMGLINSRVYNTALFYLGINILEIVLVYLLISRMNKEWVEIILKYISLIFGLYLLSFIIIDDFYFMFDELLLNRYNLLFGGILIFFVIPTGILTGLAMAFISKVKLFERNNNASLKI